MKRIALAVVALGFLAAGTALAQDCALAAATTPAFPAGGDLFVAPQEAQIGQCPGNVFATTVNYYSDSTRTVLIGSCYTNCQGQRTCTGSQSTYISFHPSCCTN